MKEVSKGNLSLTEVSDVFVEVLLLISTAYVGTKLIVSLSTEEADSINFESDDDAQSEKIRAILNARLKELPINKDVVRKKQSSQGEEVIEDDHPAKQNDQNILEDQKTLGKLKAAFSENAASVLLSEVETITKDKLGFISAKTKELTTDVIDARVWFGTKDKDVFISLFETGTILDRTIFSFLKILERKNIDNGGNPFTVRQINKDPKDLYKEDEIGQLILNLSRDILLLLGAENPNEAKLGNWSSLKGAFVEIFRPKLLNYFLKGEKDSDFSPIPKWLESMKEVILRKDPYKKIKSNIRVLLSLVNHFFFRDLTMNFFYAFQAVKETRFTAEEICGKHQFKVHNVEILKNLVQPSEKASLLFWLESEEAHKLKSLTREVFTNNKYFLLQDLKQASDHFDKKVSKVVIKTLYKRNATRSALAQKKRELIRAKGQKGTVQANETSVSLDEVITELVRIKEPVWMCPYIIDLATRNGLTITFEVAINICNESFSFDTLSRRWILKESSVFNTQVKKLNFSVDEELKRISSLDFIITEQAKILALDSKPVAPSRATEVKQQGGNNVAAKKKT